MDGKSLYLPEAQNDMAWAFIGSPWGLLLAWLVVINLAAFLSFGLDKWRARRKAKNESVRRIPEKTLFLLAVLGGSVGALLGMRVFHHKTLHRSFRIGIPVILAIQLMLAAAALYWTVLR